MTYLVLGLGSGELVVIIVIIIIIISSYVFGKNAGENKVYKEVLKNNQSNKSSEIIRLEKLLADKLISKEEFETLKEKIK